LKDADASVTMRPHGGTRISTLVDVPEIVTRYAPMRAVLALVERVAPSDAPVLISGEPGTGRTLLAHALHGQSPRAGGPLVGLRCAALPARLLESELFGHEPGAVAGSRARTAGLLARAEGGTLLLDGIEELGPSAQGTLLRAMEFSVFRAVGGVEQLRADARVIALTHRDLAGRVASGSFRGDLFSRLTAITVVLPPLRERVVDIRPLAEHFLSRRDGAHAPVLSDDAVAVLEAYAWPGNVRELQHVVERAALLARGRVIRAVDVPLAAAAAAGAPVRSAEVLVSLADMERRHIETVLRQVRWHQGRAAGILGISPKTLYRKMREYGLRRPVGSVRSL
jgi:DNA-binding NtrC family response regulator